MEKTSVLLKDVWAEFRQQNPRVRIREAARILGVSEAELVDTGSGHTASRLGGDFRKLLEQAGSLGHVMALTRNEYCVHERKGVYEKISFNNHVGLVLGADIDLRLFMNRWKYGFAVNENERLSLQFFDKEGTAVHKIYLTETSNREAYENLVKQFSAAEQDERLFIDTAGKREVNVVKNGEAPAKDANTPDEAGIAAFQKGWLELKDTHDFFGLLRKFRLNREKAMHIAPEGHATKITLRRLKEVFENAVSLELPIMVFTGSPGCIQIHTGPVKRLVQTGPWFNVLDPEFNLHLREDGIRSAWVVRKPTDDGMVTGIEVFDAGGELIVQLFGKRKPGIPEDERWRDLVSRQIGDNA